jgi:hypothetical protein
MRELLLWLSGKKTTIAMILGAILNFITTKGYIDADMSYLISAILIALGVGANIYTNKIFNRM